MNTIIRISILLLCLLYISLQIQAQNPVQSKSHSDKKQWRNGFIVKKTGDTINGMMRVTNFTMDFNNSFLYNYQNKLCFEDKIGINYEYTPDSLKSFTYYDDRDFGIDTVTLVPIINPPHHDGKIFCRLYINGPCKDYWYFTSTTEVGLSLLGSSGGSSNGSKEIEFIQLNENGFVEVKFAGFKKKMKEVFSECPIILSKLDANKYTYDNSEDMIKDYNRGGCK